MNTPAQTRTYWIYTIVSTLVMCAFLAFLPEWFWVVLPFPLTYLAKAYDAI